jgi:tetratricopeptide (TPR) repeat protein
MRSIAIGLLIIVASAVASGDKEHAKIFYRQGIQHYNLAEYEQALESFKSAYRELEDPSFLFNIAQCYRQVGDKAQAVRFYRTFLREVPAVENLEEVKQLIARLEAEIAEEQKAKSSPPQGVIEHPAESRPAAIKSGTSAATTVPAVSTAKLAITPKQPVYKRWWLWAAVVGVVAAGAAVGLAVAYTTPNNATRPPGAVVVSF